jgi:hypothetical protein
MFPDLAACANLEPPNLPCQLIDLWRLAKRGKWKHARARTKPRIAGNGHMAFEANIITQNDIGTHSTERANRYARPKVCARRDERSRMNVCHVDLTRR